MTPKVSIVMSTYNRAPLLARTLASFERQEYKDYEIIVVDDGDDGTEKVMSAHPRYKYIRCKRAQTGRHKNSSLPNNIGIRAAEGEILLLQNPECLHRSPELIQVMTSHVGEYNAVLASVMALSESDEELMWYCHPSISPRPYFFCGAIRKSWLDNMRGFDEDFTSYGYEDDDLAYRLRFAGVQFDFSEDLLAHHQWHPSGDCDIEIGRKQWQEKYAQFVSGGIGVIRNIGREWGANG